MPPLCFLFTFGPRAQWFAGETDVSSAYRGDRVNLAFRYNLLDHIGASSSLRSEISPEYPHCYEVSAPEPDCRCATSSDATRAAARPVAGAEATGAVRGGSFQRA